MVKNILIIILILIGVLLRIHRIDEIPGGLFADEIAIGINAKTIAEEGIDEFGRKFPFGFESFGDYKMPGYIYLTSIVYKFLGPQIISVRLIALLSSLISIPLIGYLAHILFPKYKTLPGLAMVVLSLSPYHIHFSRIAYETMLATAFLSLYLICVVKVIQHQNKLWLFIGSVAIVISSWSYPAPRFIIPVLTLILFVVCIVKPFYANRKNIVYSFLVLFVIIAATFIPSFYNPTMDERPLKYILVPSEDDNLVEAFSSKLVSTSSSWFRIWNFEFLFLKGDVFAFRHSTKEVGLFLSFFALPLIIGIGYFVKKNSLKEFSMIFLPLLLVISGLPSALTSSTPYAPRLLPMVIPLTLLTALGFYRLIFFINQQGRLIKIVSTFFLLTVLSYQILHYVHIYFVHFEQKSLPEFPVTTVQMNKYVKKELEKNPKRKIYFLNGISCLPWGYNELSLWYFAKLNNKAMIKWNNIFREERLKAGNLFGSYGAILHWPYQYSNNITLNPSQEHMKSASSGSLLVRCAIHKDNIDEKKEKVKEVFYMYRNKRDAIYIVSEKI